MKKLTKKVVIATTTGLASMILNAACGYGPPIDYEDPTSTYGITTEDASSDASIDASSEASVSDTEPQDNSSAASSESTGEISASESTVAPSGDVIIEEVPSDASSILDSRGDYLFDPSDVDNYKIPEVPAVYGPPTADG